MISKRKVFGILVVAVVIWLIIIAIIVGVKTAGPVDESTYTGYSAGNVDNWFLQVQGTDNKALLTLRVAGGQLVVEGDQDDYSEAAGIFFNQYFCERHRTSLSFRYITIVSRD